MRAQLSMAGLALLGLGVLALQGRGREATRAPVGRDGASPGLAAQGIRAESHPEPDLAPPGPVEPRREAGLAYLGPEELAPPTSAEPSPTTGRVGGKLSGRVVDAGGLPVPFLRLCAMQAEASAGDRQTGRETAAPGMSAEESTGRDKASFYTDKNGEFFVSDLRLERFVIVAGLALERYLKVHEPLGNMEATKSPVPTVLRLQEPHLFIRVATPNRVGEPAAERPRGRDSWSSIDVDVFDLGPSDRVDEGRSSSPMSPSRRRDVLGRYGQRLREGRYDFQCIGQPGHRYAVRARQDGRVTPIAFVDIPNDALQVTALLDLPQQPVVGRLRIHVGFAPSNDEYPNAKSEARISLFDDATGVALARPAWASGRPEGTLLEAPPGRIRIEVAGARAFVHPALRRLANRRRHGRVSAVVDLVAGEEKPVDVELPLGGAIRITARVQGARAAKRRRRSFKIRVHGEGQREEIELERLVGNEADGFHFSEHWSLGAGRVSEAIPAGRYRVFAKYAGLDEIETSVEVKSGEVADLELVFK